MSDYEEREKRKIINALGDIKTILKFIALIISFFAAYGATKLPKEFDDDTQKLLREEITRQMEDSRVTVVPKDQEDDPNAKEVQVTIPKELYDRVADQLEEKGYVAK